MSKNMVEKCWSQLPKTQSEVSKLLLLSNQWCQTQSHIRGWNKKMFDILNWEFISC